MFTARLGAGIAIHGDVVFFVAFFWNSNAKLMNLGHCDLLLAHSFCF